MTETNWAGNYVYQAAERFAPSSVAEVQALVRRGGRVRALGSRHSFNAIADTTGTQIALDRLDRIVALDPERGTVTIEGGVRYGALGVYLAEAGYALHNMASLPHISVAGACATATHGSGDTNGNLATAVVALEIVHGAGEVVTLSRDDGDLFCGAVVGLGGLGIVTKLTLEIAPTYLVRQDVYERLPFAALDEHFDAIMSSAYSVSLFTGWDGEYVQQVWLKSRVPAGAPEPPPSLFGALRATVERHPLIELAAEHCTAQLGVAGPWHERLPHFRMDHTPSNGAELQSEYFVPREQAVPALRAIRALAGRITPLLMISEVRTVAADRLWMSPSYERESVGIHFTWQPDWPAVRQVLPMIEAALAPWAARPHWGKLFTVTPDELRRHYPRLPDFQALLRSFDPHGIFRNAMLDAYVFGEG